MRRALIGKELLDVPGSATRAEIRANLRNIKAANRWLGGTSLVLSHLAGLIGDRPAHQPVRLLDLATGAADIPVAIAQWARRRGISVLITAVDHNPVIVELAREDTRHYPEICVDTQDILHLPYKEGAFDFAVASQIIHHLDTDEVRSLLSAANRLATQGMVISDLRRGAFCIAVAAVASNLVSNRLSRHDARLSFRNAFTPAELAQVAEETGLPCCSIYTHGPCRLALVVDKRTAAKCPSENHVIRQSPALV